MITWCEDADEIFRVFTACQGDPSTLILDVRPYKEYSKQHIVHAFCVRVPSGSSNNDVLLDYSKASYDHQTWSEACWWDKHCILYGPQDLKKDHPVALFLAKDGHARSIKIYPDGFSTFAARFPFLTTAGVRTQRDRVYPSLIDRSPSLYLGNWGHAENIERLKELNIKNIITIHNHPSRLKNFLPPTSKHLLQIEMADVDTEDITPWFKPTHEFIEAAGKSSNGGAVLVHCGAGVSRSATLVISYLMQRHKWTAQAALDNVKARRSIVQPNDGFWRALCALEESLGIEVEKRSNTGAFSGIHGKDWNENLNTQVPDHKIDDDGVSRNKRERRERSRSREREYSRRRRSRSRSRSLEERHRRKDDSKGGGERDRGGARGSSGKYRNKDDYNDDYRSKKKERSRSREKRENANEQKLVLDIVKDGLKVETLKLDSKKECIFGRLPSCTIPLDHMSISRQHARIHLDGSGKVFITDLGSNHGSNVDGVWIRSNAPKELNVGSVIRLGASTREYHVTSIPR